MTNTTTKSKTAGKRVTAKSVNVAPVVEVSKPVTPIVVDKPSNGKFYFFVLIVLIVLGAVGYGVSSVKKEAPIPADGVVISEEVYDPAADTEALPELPPALPEEIVSDEEELKEKPAVAVEKSKAIQIDVIGN